jgi:hypothetical protein
VTVIVLSNVMGASTEKVATNLSAIVFGAKYELPRERKVITLSAEVLDKYVGEYRLSPTITLTVSKEGSRLMLGIVTQPKMELFAESETDFFLKAVDAGVTFVKDSSGNVTQLLLRQGSGSGTPAVKIK